MSAVTLTPSRPGAAAVAPNPGRSLRDGLRLAGWQVRYEQRAFWRNRTAAFFCFLLPLMFVVVFGTINGSDVVASRGGIKADFVSVPGVLAYGVVMATFTNLAVTTAALREQGVLKRLRGTPLPGWIYLAGRIGSAVIVALLMAGATMALGALAYGVDVRASTLPGLLLALVLGTACFSALGLAVAGAIRNADGAMALANALVLPLTFASDVWAVFGGIPGWLTGVADVFPIRHLAHALQTPFDPRTTGSGVAGVDLLVLAGWLALGVVLAAGAWRAESRRG
jgi:ABC-2 type transport system permease protein